jgi:hypothetical protein
MMIGGGGGSTIALSMLSLVGGMYLLMKAWTTEVCCKLFVKIVAWAIVVISILMILSGGYWKVVKMSHHGFGYGKWGKGMMHKGMMMKGMSPEMMKNCPMMQMMEQMKEGAEGTAE